MEDYKELDSGTNHHNYMHQMNGLIVRIGKLCKHMDVLKLLEDIQEKTEHYVMWNIERGKNE